MKYTVGVNKANIRYTGALLTSIVNADHDVSQFIENYFKAMYDETLAMRKLHFYSGTPADKSTEITPDQAMAEMKTGFPILVKHDDVKDEVVPFVMRKDAATGQDTIFSGQDLLALEKHKKPDLGFDYEAFRATPKPAKPGFWANLLGAIGFPGKQYSEYKEYERREKLLLEHASDIRRYETENAAYKLAEEIDEGHGLSEYVEELRQHKKKAASEILGFDVDAVEEERTVQGSDDLNETLNIDDVLKERAATEEPATPKARSTEYEETDIRLLESTQSSKIDLYERQNRFILSKGEYENLSEEEQKYFVQQDRRNYIEREYYIKVNKLLKPSKQEVSFRKNPLDPLPVIDVEEEKRTAEEYTEEDRAEVRGILNRLHEEREIARNNVAKVITSELLAVNENLDERKTLETVRFGNTFKLMSVKATNLDTLGVYAVEYPGKLRDLYLKELQKSGEVHAREEEEEVKQAEMREAEKVEKKPEATEEARGVRI